MAAGGLRPLDVQMQQLYLKERRHVSDEKYVAMKKVYLAAVEHAQKRLQRLLTDRVVQRHETQTARLSHAAVLTFERLNESRHQNFVISMFAGIR